MAFQPIINIEAKRVFAYEALVRGTDGESAFTVLSQLTVQNQYAFDQACRVTAITLAKTLGLEKTSAKLSINFMPGAVYNLAACIQLTLATAQNLAFPLDRLIFEITEGEEVKDRAHLRGIFDEYRRHGFKMALDDFGAGFSGFNLFVDLSPDILKLDMALIRDLHKRSVALITVRSLVELCTKLGVVLIAEGVETKEEFHALRSCGVRMMQGYLFARPAFEALPGFSLPQGDQPGDGTVLINAANKLSFLPDTIKKSAQQVPMSFVLLGHLDLECLNRLTKVAATNLNADGAFLLLNTEGALTVVCQSGSTVPTEVETLKFAVDSGPARGGASVISHSVADRTTLVTIALQEEGRFLGVFGVNNGYNGAITPAQECILQKLAVEISGELVGAWRAIDQPQADRLLEPDSIDQQLKMLQSVVVYANDSVLITEAEPVTEPGPRIVYANPAFTRLTGYTMEEVLGKTPRLLQGPASGMKARAKIREALTQWKSVEVELLNYRKDGSEFWVELSISPVANTAGWYTHWVSVQRDITQRKEREQLELGRAQSALMKAEAFAATGRLAATIAHEISNPLEAVTNLIYLAKTTTGITQELSGMLSLADQELTRVGKIAQQTLGFYVNRRTRESLMWVR